MNSFLGRVDFGEGNESESAGLLSAWILHDLDFLKCTEFAEDVFEILLSRPWVQAADVDVITRVEA